MITLGGQISFDLAYRFGYTSFCLIVLISVYTGSNVIYVKVVSCNNTLSILFNLLNLNVTILLIVSTMLGGNEVWNLSCLTFLFVGVSPPTMLMVSVITSPKQVFLSCTEKQYHFLKVATQRTNMCNFCQLKRIAVEMWIWCVRFGMIQKIKLVVCSTWCCCCRLLLRDIVNDMVWYPFLKHEC